MVSTPIDATGLDDDAPGLARSADLAARCPHHRRKRVGKPFRAAEAKLRLGRACEQRRDVMPEPAQAQVHFAQAVEEQQSRPHHRVLELALDELERRERARLKQ